MINITYDFPTILNEDSTISCMHCGVVVEEDVTVIDHSATCEYRLSIPVVNKNELKITDDLRVVLNQDSGKYHMISDTIKELDVQLNTEDITRITKDLNAMTTK